jgi:hypothetical protein
VDPSDEFYSNPTKFIQSRIDSKTSNLRLELSEEMMRAAHPDYDETIKSFSEAVESNPSLVHQFNAAPNPAKFAYDYCKTFAKVRGVGSFEDLEKKIRAEVEAEYEEKAKKAAVITAAENTTTSSAGARGSGATTEPAYTGPTPLSKLAPGVGL